MSGGGGPRAAVAVNGQQSMGQPLMAAPIVAPIEMVNGHDRGWSSSSVICGRRLVGGSGEPCVMVCGRRLVVSSSGPFETVRERQRRSECSSGGQQSVGQPLMAAPIVAPIVMVNGHDRGWSSSSVICRRRLVGGSGDP